MINFLFPTCRIIPFVAADAVVDEPPAAYENYQPEIERVYNVSDVEESPLPVVNSFSPPIETEGNINTIRYRLGYIASSNIYSNDVCTYSLCNIRIKYTLSLRFIIYK